MALAYEIGERIVCAVKLSYGCRSDPLLASPTASWRDEVRDNAPRIVYERGMRALPVDFRGLPHSGLLRRTADRPRHALARRAPGDRLHPRDRLPRSRGSRRGPRLRLLRRARRAHLHPVLDLLRGLGDLARPARGRRATTATTGRATRSGSTRTARVDARASSHNGYNGADAPAVDWASDAPGRCRAPRWSRDAAESLGLRGERGWTRRRGRSTSPAEATPAMPPRGR